MRAGSSTPATTIDCKVSRQWNAASGSRRIASFGARSMCDRMMGVDLTRVAYRGSGPAITALIAGEYQGGFVRGVQ